MSKEKFTFSQAVEEFLTIKRAGTIRTYQDYAYRCRIIKQIADMAHIAGKPLAEITVVDLSKAITFLDQSSSFTKLGPTTKNKIISAMGTMFRAYIQMGRISSNPAIYLPKRRATPRQAKPFTGEELQALLNVVPASAAQYRDRAMVYVMADAGLRASELLNLKISDWKDQILRISKGKGSKPRQVSVGMVTRQILDEYFRNYRESGSEYLFVTKDGMPLNIHSLNKRIQSYQKKAGIAHASPHRFRATFATNFAKTSNGNLFQLQALLGHATLDMSRKYVQLAVADEAQIANAQQSQVDRVLKPLKSEIPEQDALQTQIAILNLKLQKMTLEMDIMQKEYSCQLR